MLKELYNLKYMYSEEEALKIQELNKHLSQKSRKRNTKLNPKKVKKKKKETIK